MRTSARFRSAAAVTATLPMLVLLAGFQFSTAGPVNKTPAGVALKGHDPVAYFEQGVAVKGSPEISHAWMGATWHFTTAAHRDLFARDPSRYAPQYGGYCAYGVSRGYKADIDPDVWKVVDGKLYLNYDAKVGRTWNRDIPGHISKADENWPKIRTP